VGRRSRLEVLRRCCGTDRDSWRCNANSQSRSVIVDNVDEGGITELGMEGIGGGAMHVCAPSWVRGTGCRHVEHFTVGRSWESLSWGWSGGFFGIEVIMREIGCCQCWRIVVVVIDGEGESTMCVVQGQAHAVICCSAQRPERFLAHQLHRFGYVRYVHSSKKYIHVNMHFKS
jgi:hypothetical protein